MSTQFVTLRHLCFTGPDKTPANLYFGPGLNLVYGASETGKSFILEAINFMLGAKELRDIPERNGYERIWLGLETSSGDQFTLERSPQGGSLRCYNGLIESPPEEEEPHQVLSAKHNPTNEDNVSTFLLKRIGLADKKLLYSKRRGVTHNLSFRNLVPLLLVSEQDIQKRESPIYGGQRTEETKEKALFKLLLSGVDDSAVEPEQDKIERKISDSAKAEVIDRLIDESREKLKSLIGEEDNAQELKDQLNKLESTLIKERNDLSSNEREYRHQVSNRRELRLALEAVNSRCDEISEMLVRFALLDEHYKSDLERLDGISEAGSLLTALNKTLCPLCGATPKDQNEHADCDGNLEVIIKAARSEKEKIIRMRDELSETVSSLRSEHKSNTDNIPELEGNIQSVQQQLFDLEPALSASRSSYVEVFEKASTIRQAIALIAQIGDLEEMKHSNASAPNGEDNQEQIDSGLSSSMLDSFSQCYQEILQSWNFPDAERTHFDTQKSDFVISGKPRGSRGKGLRSITHAAFNVGLLEFARRENKCHPGFVVLDTPLLAYREPEGDEDDLRGTDVASRFFDYLANIEQGQVIVLENIEPPESIIDKDQTVFFTQNPHEGRYGFFPSEEASPNAHS